MAERYRRAPANERQIELRTVLMVARDQSALVEEGLVPDRPPVPGEVPVEAAAVKRRNKKESDLDHVLRSLSRLFSGE